MSFPIHRPRRIRSVAGLRSLARETSLSADNLILPLFVRHGKNFSRPISSMPGHAQLSTDRLVPVAKKARSLGLPAVILFGIPDRKDPGGSGAYSENGVVQAAVKRLKDTLPDLVVIADLCLCEYTDHGHCGIVRKHGNAWALDNDATLEVLQKAAASLAGAGVDMVAPSAMADGQVGAIRKALDTSGHGEVPILAYAAKYESAFYGPFREAAQSPPRFGDRSSYQMDPANIREALREIRLDLEEGADMVMVKPALSYLDVLSAARKECSVPLGAYNVSGEFSMLKAAAANGWLDEKRATLEILNSIRRAGADFIITYHALEAARWLNEGRKR